jgi:hypothetical protein
LEECGRIRALELILGESINMEHLMLMKPASFWWISNLFLMLSAWNPEKNAFYR